MLEEYFRSVLGESTEEIVNREKRGEAKRKAEDDGADNKKARAEAEAEQRGVKRGSDDWDQMAKRLREGIERRAAERSNPGAGVDVSMAEVMAVLAEKEETWSEYEDELYYELMIKELAHAARKVGEGDVQEIRSV